MSASALNVGKGSFLDDSAACAVRNNLQFPPVGNQMRGNKDGAPAGITFLVRPNHRLDELAPDYGIQAGGRFVQQQ